MPDGALSFLYLLHPDPWPKARHAKRRMVNDRPVDLFRQAEARGEFRLATDDPTYLNWSLMIMQRHQHQFDWLAERPKDFLEPSGGWIRDMGQSLAARAAALTICATGEFDA